LTAARNRLQREAALGDAGPSCGIWDRGGARGIGKENEPAKNIVDDLLQDEEGPNSGGLVCAVIASVVLRNAESNAPRSLHSEFRDWCVFQELQAKRRGASEEEMERLKVVLQAVWAIRMVEKPNLCAPTLVAQEYILDFLRGGV
jgi:hypothetical protein